MITSAKYNAYGSIDIVIDGEKASVPADDFGNRHRVMLAEWEKKPGNKIAAYEPPPPSASDVDQERDRRTAGGFSFGGSFYQSRPEDRENIAGAATAALAAMVNGAQPGDYRWHGGESDFIWIAADNSTHPLDAQSTFAMGQAAMKHKQDHIFAARALKDADPIPPDFADDGHWPSP